MGSPSLLILVCKNVYHFFEAIKEIWIKDIHSLSCRFSGSRTIGMLVTAELGNRVEQISARGRDKSILSKASVQCAFL